MKIKEFGPIEEKLRELEAIRDGYELLGKEELLFVILSPGWPGRRISLLKKEILRGYAPLNDGSGASS